MTTYDPKAAAARGAALLDEKDPGWLESMPEDLTRLEMDWPTGCVLGRRCGSYSGGLSRLGLLDDDPYLYGFDAPEKQYYPDLTQAWRHLITARREAVAG